LQAKAGVLQARKEQRMNEKCLLDRMAKVVSEIQRINLWIDGAATNYMARQRYKKFKATLQELVQQHKGLTKKYEFLGKEE
jgi:hypothetical protein